MIEQEDEDEDREALEKHQLDALNANAQQEKEVQEEKEKLDKLNEFEAKLEKIKTDNEAILKGKNPLNMNFPKKKKNADTSESSDEN